MHRVGRYLGKICKFSRSRISVSLQRTRRGMPVSYAIGCIRRLSIRTLCNINLLRLHHIKASIIHPIQPGESFDMAVLGLRIVHRFETIHSLVTYLCTCRYTRNVRRYRLRVPHEICIGTYAVPDSRCSCKDCVGAWTGVQGVYCVGTCSYRQQSERVESRHHRCRENPIEASLRPPSESKYSSSILECSYSTCQAKNH